MNKETSGDFICLDCGVNVGDRHYTMLNKAGPYCDECIGLAQEQEEINNSRK